MQLSLSGKNALVGGSSRGIGKAIAIELAALGANVTLVSRDVHMLSAVKAQLDNSQGQSHDFVSADFGEPERLRRIILPLTHRKPIHILINNTGGPKGGPIAQAEPQAFLQAFQAHLICNQVLAQLLLEGMKREGFGRIINIISTSVKEPIEGLGVSNTIRAAVANWAKTLAGEVACHGITVNNVLPGFTETDRLEDLIQTRAQQEGIAPEAVAERMKASVPARRFGQAAEVAAAVAFLASPSAAYINGINLPVDGGRTRSL